MTRWIMAIKEYDFSIKYCKASENKMANTVSRYPPVEQEKYSAVKKKFKILAVKYVLSDNFKTQLKNISVEQQRDKNLKKVSHEIKDRDKMCIRDRF